MRFKNYLLTETLWMVRLPVGLVPMSALTIFDKLKTKELKVDDVIVDNTGSLIKIKDNKLLKNELWRIKDSRNRYIRR